MKAAEQALDEVHSGQVLGLGTGRAAAAFIAALGRRMHKENLRIRGVATSEASANLARRLGIPLITLDEVEMIDLAIDGADEVDPHLNLIKGRGGALLREKVVAEAARRFIVIVGAEKVVPALGSHGVLPVEVVPFSAAFCQRRLERLGCRPSLRIDPLTGDHFLTDNRNPILDCRIDPIDDPATLEHQIRAIPGVVGTGLFLGIARRVFVQEDAGTVRVLDRSQKG